MVVPNPDPATPLRIYVAGPLFSEAERAWLDTLATALRAAGHECFVPHEESAALTEFTGRSIYQLDGDGLRSANVLVAWLDGIGVDDGTACEIGIFAELVRSGGQQYLKTLLGPQVCMLFYPDEMLNDARSILDSQNRTTNRHISMNPE